MPNFIRNLLESLSGDNNPPLVVQSTGTINTAVAIKAASGDLYGINVINPNAYAVSVKLYNTAAASVVVGTTVPQLNFAVASSAGLFLRPESKPISSFSTAMSVACTSGLAIVGSGLSPGGVCVEAFYQ